LTPEQAKATRQKLDQLSKKLAQTTEGILLTLRQERRAPYIAELRQSLQTTKTQETALSRLYGKLDLQKTGTMTEQALRNQVIRLAHANPELRPHLLPLLVKHAGKIPPQFLENVNKAKAKAKAKDDGKGKKKDDKNDFFEKMKAKKDDKSKGKKDDKSKGKQLSKEDFLAKMEAGKKKKKAKSTPSIRKWVEELVVDDYPYGQYTTEARFFIEKGGRGQRVGRVTVNPKTGRPNKPKYTTYAVTAKIGVGDDGKTYLLLGNPGQVHFTSSDMQHDVGDYIYPADAEYPMLAKVLGFHATPEKVQVKRTPGGAVLNGMQGTQTTPRKIMEAAGMSLEGG